MKGEAWLIIGLGGSGARVLTSLRGMMPPASGQGYAEYLHIDADWNAPTVVGSSGLETLILTQPEFPSRPDEAQGLLWLPRGFVPEGRPRAPEIASGPA